MANKPRYNKADRRSKGKKNQQYIEHIDYALVPPPVQKKQCEPLYAITAAIGKYMTAIDQYQIVFAQGPAGTGKSYTAVAMACEALADKRIGRIIITRPAIEVGKAFGPLPGELTDKYAPYMIPIVDILNERMGKSQAKYALEHGIISFIPLEYMLGMTLKDAWVILDEAQNTTITQMEMFLTRPGSNTKMIINGSLRQKHTNHKSGLADAMQILNGIRKIAFVEFSADDCIRSGICRDIIRAYDA